MSFYLLPAASYQTQQKLKEQMEGKRKDLQKRKKSTSSSSSKHRSSKAPSISAPSINTSRTPRSSVSSSGNDSFLAPSARKMSIFPSESRSSRGSHDITHKKGLVSSSLYNDSIYDEYANTSSSSSSTMSSIHLSRRPSTATSLFNYSSNADMHQVLKVSKQHALKKKVDVADSMAKMSLDSAGYDSENKDIKVQFKSVNFQGSDAETSINTHSAASIPQMDAPKPAYSIVEQEDSGSDSEEPNNLHRVYSNVSSIFSTKKSSLYKSPSASTSTASSPLGNAAENDHIDLGHKPANKFARFKKKFST